MNYEMERPNGNPNLVVPGTGYVNAGYAEQQAAGINYTDNAHMVHYKLAQHRAAESAKAYANMNAKPATVAKPVSYPYVAPAKASNVGARTATATSADPMASAAEPAKKAPSVVKPLMAPAVAVVMFALKYLAGFILAYLLGWGLLSHLAHFMLGTRLQSMVVFGAMALNVLWLVFRFAWATGRGLKKLGTVTTAKGTSVDKNGKLAVNL
ncbi:hypothetical protein [Paraburkholderia aromaticivorans]|uniref:hypothetical protein n=1 Tax=Paraburkholderia aromaticivorans TaxID=2026199 RepID=UPI0038BA3A74